jgi:hypothetical protein
MPYRHVLPRITPDENTLIMDCAPPPARAGSFFHPEPTFSLGYHPSNFTHQPGRLPHYADARPDVVPRLQIRSISSTVTP